jgi:hypothetical protein
MANRILRLSTLAAAMAFAAACSSSDDNAQPTVINVNDSGATTAGSTGSTGDGGTADGGSTGTTAGSTGSTAGSAEAGAPDVVSDVVTERGPGVLDAASCSSDAGCVCILQSANDYLNQCTSSQCAPFDNEARLPLYNHGALPAVP